MAVNIRRNKEKSYAVKNFEQHGKNFLSTLTGFLFGYGVVPAAAGYYAAQKAPYWFLKEHAKAAAYNAAMRFAPHIAAGISTGLPLVISAAYLGSELIAAGYAKSKEAEDKPVLEPLTPAFDVTHIASATV